MISLLSKLFSSKTTRKVRSAFKPRLEVLEDRCVPASLYWNPAGADHNWGTLANWHQGGDMGAQAAALPNGGTFDYVTFDNAKSCTLDVSATIHGLTFTGTSTNVLSMSGNTLTENGGGFSFAAGTVDFGSSGGTLTIQGNATDTWTGTAGFTSSNGSGSVILQGDALNSISEKLTVTGTGQKKMQATLFIGVATDTIHASMDCTTAGEIALGGTGTIYVTSEGVLDFLSTGTFSISCTHGTNPNELIDEGQIWVSVDIGQAGGTDTVDVPINLRDSGLLTIKNGCTLSVHNYYNTTLEAISQSGTSNCKVYTGCTLTVDAKGYVQTAGDFWVIDINDGTNLTFTSNGKFEFAGKVKVNETNTAHIITWNARGGVGTLIFDSTCDLYLHIGRGTGKTYDAIEALSVTLGGTLHVANNGTFDTAGQWMEPIQADNAMSGSFANIYDGWTGTTALGLTPSITANHDFRLTK